MKSPEAYLLPHANIQWQTADTPYTPTFDDIYWSAGGGLEEKQHVFLKGCDIENRWQHLPAHSQFTIVETGFGFGLNFLLTLRAWQSTSLQNHARLEYIAYEQYLVKPDDLRRMAANFGLEPETELLLKYYPAPVPGNHTIWITDDVCLHLVVGEIHDQIASMKVTADAVYLDGFSPSRNSAMWDERLLNTLTDCLRPGGRLATYSVAGNLRRAIEQQGLITEKPEGFGRKRSMLVAEKPGTWQPKIQKTKRAIIVGAGLSGLLCAKALAQRGHNVTVIDQHATPLGALRQINQIAIYPQLSKTPQPYSNLYLRAYQYFLRHSELQGRGRIELLETDSQLDYGRAIAAQLPDFVELIDAQRASDLLGLSVAAPALYFANAGWIAPNLFHTSIETHQGEVSELTKTADGWRLDIKDQSAITADVVVLATGHQHMTSLAPLELMSLRGQSLRLLKPGIAPKMVYSGEKTWFPLAGNESTVSGTYDRFDADLASRTADTEALLGAVRPFLKDVPNVEAGVGIRCATRDRMPVVDQLPNWQSLQDYLSLPPISRGPFTAHEPGLYCAVGFGSHGGTLGPYCTDLLARMISDEPVAEDMRQLSAVRFAFRDAGIKQ